MKTMNKRAAIAGLGAACVLSLSIGAGMLAVRPAQSAALAEDATAPNVKTYFYDNLVDAENKEYTLAKKFYKAFEELDKNGDFKDGRVDYALDKILTSDEIKGWVENGELTIPKAFGAARDAFRTDHPEIFYIDFYKLTISAGRSGGVYSAYIDSGREANAYMDKSINTEAKVNTAINALNAKIDEIAAKANEEAEKDTYSTAKEVVKARYVNKYLAEYIEYDYVAYDNKDNENADVSSQINTPYGGLVLGKSVCGGYSTSFKVVMDKLGIPCLTVNGTSNQKDETGKNSSGSVYHMWNYVWLANPPAAQGEPAAYSARANGGEWYSVDVTWNSPATNKNKYMLMSASADELIHVNDGVISSSGYELVYPELSSHNYGSTGETDGLQFSIIYESSGNTDEYDNDIVQNWETISYNGKGAKRLIEEDNLHIVFRNAFMDKKTGEMKWTSWCDLDGYRQYVAEATGADNLVVDSGNETKQYGNPSYLYSQYAVFEVGPDMKYDPVYGRPDAQANVNLFFSDDCKIEENIEAISDLKVNESFGTYTPPPHAMKSNPSFQAEQTISDSMRDPKIKDKVIMSEKYAYNISVTYNEDMHILDESKPIGITFVNGFKNIYEYAKLLPLDDQGTLVELVKSSPDSGYDTLKFKFIPSLMYEHNRCGYSFTFTNVGSAKLVAKKVDGQLTTVTSDKLPNSVYYNFSRISGACPARFNYDGRLWIECCAQPTLIDNSDLSVNGFKDEEGNSTFSEHERSQMMLVVENVNEETENSMLDAIDSNKDMISADDIHASQTYDIRLQICNKYPTISDGSYIKMALGFPEGYGPDMAGVTFKLFHRKHIQGDEYIIEEIPCVVTQFGIVATVTSFSPYMVAVVDADKATTKNVFASINGAGGKLNAQDGQIQALEKAGDKYTYTIKPDEGYMIYSVTLNNKQIKDQVTADGKLTLNYEDLDANNELEIKYIAIEAAQRFVDKEIAEPVKVMISTEGESNKVEGTGGVQDLVIPEIPNPTPTPNPGNTDKPLNTTAIIISVVAVVVALGAGVAVVMVLKRKQH